MVVAGLARLGQLHAGGVAEEQRRAHGGLEIGNPLAGGSHGQVGLARAGRDAALPGHGHEQAKRHEVEARQIHVCPKGSDTYRLRRSMTARAMVPASTYSSSPPTGTPRASRDTLSPRAFSISPM
ncbi:hypothetical protein D3C85_1451790 [compost metagenome]